MIRVSTVIVKYKAETEFHRCITSIPKRQTEIITVDNNRINKGYAAGNNLGAKRSSKEYLFILNPDTVLFPDTLQKLIHFLDTHPNAAIVAPLLLDSKHIPYPLQGTSELTPLSAIFGLSFIYKLWPRNPVANHYWLKDWDKKSSRSVSVVPGTAFLIRRQVFEQVGGFDENFFLYFEESDLCRRIKQLGYHVWIDPASKLVHHWAKSTPSSGRPDIFAASRKFYFKKNYGSMSALIVELFCNPRGVLKSFYADSGGSHSQ